MANIEPISTKAIHNRWVITRPLLYTMPSPYNGSNSHFFRYRPENGNSQIDIRELCITNAKSKK